MNWIYLGRTARYLTHSNTGSGHGWKILEISQYWGEIAGETALTLGQKNSVQEAIKCGKQASLSILHDSNQSRQRKMANFSRSIERYTYL